MFKYILHYRWADIRQMMDNDRSPQNECAADMKGKVCLVTGATSGVGREAVLALAAHGASIVMINRSVEKSEAICAEIRSRYHTETAFFTADFTNLREVHDAADAILRAYPRIDVLINNAGIHCTKKTYTQDHIETVFCVNHLASFLLTYKLLERMKQYPGSRIIQVNSQGHRFGGLNVKDVNWEKRHYTGLRGYGASKTAQLLTVREFADMLRGTGVTINAMHPGAVRSAIGENNGPLYRWFKRTVLAGALVDPAISGRAIHYLAAAPELASVSGQYFNLTHPEKPAPHALDRKIGKIIWDISMKMAGLG
ncbi:MAG: SDR family NAD(P)-dependent oxidoreductase [Spirochaetes bacterium]|nr:SDR family NAD(P)-dependent oxidoreductase [Spirochaetota bacterium]